MNKWVEIDYLSLFTSLTLLPIILRQRLKVFYEIVKTLCVYKIPQTLYSIKKYIVTKKVMIRCRNIDSINKYLKHNMYIHKYNPYNLSCGIFPHQLHFSIYKNILLYSIWNILSLKVLILLLKNNYL